MHQRLFFPLPSSVNPQKPWEVGTVSMLMLQTWEQGREAAHRPEL